jgi:hypothetical protein
MICEKILARCAAEPESLGHLDLFILHRKRLLFAEQQRRELLVDHRGQRLVDRHAADLSLGTAPPGQTALPVNAHEGCIE